MKSLGESFGFDILLTVFLPGLAVFLGMMVAFPDLPARIRADIPAVSSLVSEDGASVAKDKVSNPKSSPAGDKEWLQIFAALALISLLGASVAAINSVCETFFYDWITPILLGIDGDTFQSHWDEYLYRLAKESSSYIDRIVNWFLFESRMAVAMVVIIVMELLSVRTSSTLTIIFGVAFIAFALVAMMHHYELGKYRLTRAADWQAMRLADVATANRQVAEAAGPALIERLNVVERQMKAMRKRARRNHVGRPSFDGMPRGIHAGQTAN